MKVILNLNYTGRSLQIISGPMDILIQHQNMGKINPIN